MQKNKQTDDQKDPKTSFREIGGGWEKGIEEYLRLNSLEKMHGN